MVVGHVDAVRARARPSRVYLWDPGDHVASATLPHFRSPPPPLVRRVTHARMFDFDA
jgi:hypothetical protein